MSYAYGQTKLKPLVAMTADQVRVELERLNDLRAAILAETAAKEKELNRIRAARKRLIPVSTNKPSAEAIAYREQHAHIIAAQPEPVYGGKSGLRMATAESARHDERKRLRSN